MHLFKIILASIYALTVSYAFSATKTATTGLWENASTWTPSGKPSNGDDVFIPDGVTVTVNGNNYSAG